MTEQVETALPQLETMPGQRALERSGPRDRRLARRRLAVLAYTGPALLWFTAFMVVPLASMFYLALVRWDSLIAPRTYVGLANYREMFGDSLFHDAARNTAIQLAVAIPVMIPLAFLLGYFLSRKPPGYRVLSVIFFTPGLISASARAMMFVGVYQPDGILNRVLSAIGLGALKHIWLADNSTSLWTVVGVELWGGIGWTAVLFAAALGAIPEEIYEAARLDGATTWQIIVRISYPLTRSFFGLMTMLQFLWLLTSAQDVLLLTKGGPGSSSLTLAYMLYDQAFVSGRVGFSQAIAVVVFVVGLLGMLVIRAAFPDPATAAQQHGGRRP